jgi:hypothetical protein
MAKNFEKLIFGGLHEKHAVQRGIWVPTQHFLWDQGKPRKTLIELAGRRTFRMQTPWTARSPYLYPLVIGWLWPRALSSLFVSSYDSQGYGEGILTAFTPLCYFIQLWSLVYNILARTEWEILIPTVLLLLRHSSSPKEHSQRALPLFVKRTCRKHPPCCLLWDAS